MTTLREAATQALGALEGGADSWQLVGPAIDALKEALVEDAMQKFTDVNQELEAALGCDHCNQPLYAAVKCRVCGRVTEPVQEPVAWCDIEEDGTIHGLRYWSEPGRREHALYTHPPRREWRGLSKDESLKLWGMRSDGPSNTEITSFSRAIEAALKERNA